MRAHEWIIKVTNSSNETITEVNGKGRKAKNIKLRELLATLNPGDIMLATETNAKAWGRYNHLGEILSPLFK